MKLKSKEMLIMLFRTGYLVFSFFLADALLRVLTRWIGCYSIFELAPNLFSALWALLLVAVLSLLPKKVGRWVYLGVYIVAAVFSLCQYGYYLIFDKFFYLSDIANAGEGADYAGWVLTVLNKEFVVMLICLIAAGAIGVWQFPDFKTFTIKAVHSAQIGILVLFIAGQAFIPKLYGMVDSFGAIFINPEYEYGAFSNSGFDMELTGLYQYVFKDATRNLNLKKQANEDLLEIVDNFLVKKEGHESNEMTGILEGKNLIIIQMESIDDWLITQEVMPTVYRLMLEGINCTNMYTPIYSSGSTFSTEFAFNTGMYPGTQGAIPFSYAQNEYPYTIANILHNRGYETNSFHENNEVFYNRAEFHHAMGYKDYNQTTNDIGNAFLATLDEYIIETDAIWEKMVSEESFYNFIITYSAHLAYDSSDSIVQYAMKEYPEYFNNSDSFELCAIRAKARLTDDMFAALLRRLEEDDLLENTVIMAYADHYAYGLSDKELLQKLSEEAGSGILERVPAFIWYEGCKPMEVDKVCQTIDWVPTLANMFGVNVVPYVMGNDIFDPSYPGYAIFPNGTWLTNKAYAVNGTVRWNNGMTSEDIQAMNEFVLSFYEVNEAILPSDYYRHQD